MSSAGSGINRRPRDLESVKEVHEFQQFSHDIEKRRCTDILCIIIGLLFFIVMLIITLSIYNKQHYIKANFPTDSDGKLCGIQQTGYQFLYFTSSTEITQRVCVRKCPVPNDTKLACKATKTRGCNYNNQEGYKVEKYETEPWQDRNGFFCMPKDQTSRRIILQKSKLSSRNIFFNSADTYILCSLISVILALVFFVTVQFLPKIINQYIIYLGAVVLLILVICTWTYPTDYIKSKIVIGLILIGFFIIVALTTYLFRDALKANGVFLYQATRFIKDFPWILVNIPLFLGITLLFTYVMILELNSIWTHSDLIFQNDKSLYWEYKSGQGAFLTFLWIIQTIWGLNFIKQSFNFIVSSFAVLWYNGYIDKDGFNKTSKCDIFTFPYRIYWTKHFGSVIACAFMSSFFNIFDTIFDLVRNNKGQNTICDNIDHFFDLVRSQSLAYVTITGNAYCNSARYTEYLCNNSGALQYSQSVSRAFRISVYSSLSGIVAILGLYIKGTISIYGIAIIIVFSYFIVNFFIQMHADSSDAIMVVYLQNQQFLCRGFIGEAKNRSDFNRKVMKQQIGDKDLTREIIEQLEKERLFPDQRQHPKQKSQVI